MTTQAGPIGRRGNRWSLFIWGGAACLLLVPLIAMQFTGEVRWTAGDFATFGAMLAVACGVYELAARLTGSPTYRAAAGVAVAAAFMLVWMTLAVGIIGDEDNRLNLMYAALLAIGPVGAFIAAGQAAGMARTLATMAFAQGVIAAVAFTYGYETLILNGGFAALWLLSAWLFQRASRKQAAQAVAATE